MDLSTTFKPEFLKPELVFEWPEYIIFVVILVASLGIGVFYGFFANKNKTNEDFLMAGRSMSSLPVTLSLICSFVSAITLLGNPVEVYFYGTQYIMIALSYIPMTLVLMYFYVPVYFRLQLTSAYQYLEWRFSRRIRMICSVFAIIHLMFYMPTTVYGPGLALEQVAKIDSYVSCASIFLVCIAYSSLGGLRAVLWTDALQATVMLITLLAIVVAGIIEVGGFELIWERSSNSGRIEFFNTDLDPRTRYTIWGSVIGGFFMWLPLFAATQAQIQRYNSVPSLTKSRLTLIFNMTGLITVMILVGWIGMMIFAQFYDCDPVAAEILKSPDQLLPYFVVKVLGGYTMLPGLLVAGATCASLSTVSSALNSLTAIITEDFVKHYKPGMSEERLAKTSKIVSTVCGIIAFALIFVVAEVNKTIQVIAFSTVVQGSLLAPVLGVFTLGMMFPWVNELGILLGLVSSISISLFVGIGNIIAGRQGKLPNQKLFLTTANCTLAPGSEFNDLNSFYDLHESQSLFDNMEWKNKEDSFAVQVWSISYIWQPAIGAITTILFGIIFSALVHAIRKNKGHRVNESLLSKPFTRLWTKLFGKVYVNNWIDFDSPAHCSSSGVPETPEEFQNNNILELQWTKELKIKF